MLVQRTLVRASLPNAALLLSKVPPPTNGFGDSMRSKALLLTSVVLCASNVPANALSWSSQMNCAGDSYTYCSMHTAGSAEHHACMRANRPKLSTSCVSALIDDGVLPKTIASQRKTKIAAATAQTKPAPRTTARPVASPVDKAPSAKVATAKATPMSALPIADAASEPLARAPEPLATPPQQPMEAAPAMDQKTFEALKSRAPYFLVTEDLASMFSQIEHNASPQPSTPR